MMENRFKSSRPGTGCSPEPEFEVMPEEMAPARTGDIRIGRVTMCRETTINSPFFWLLGGCLVGGVAVYLVLRETRR